MGCPRLCDCLSAAFVPVHDFTSASDGQRQGLHRLACGQPRQDQWVACIVQPPLVRQRKRFPKKGKKDKEQKYAAAVAPASVNLSPTASILSLIQSIASGVAGCSHDKLHYRFGRQVEQPLSGSRAGQLERRRPGKVAASDELQSRGFGRQVEQPLSGSRAGQLERRRPGKVAASDELQSRGFGRQVEQPLSGSRAGQLERRNKEALHLFQLASLQHVWIACTDITRDIGSHQVVAHGSSESRRIVSLKSYGFLSAFPLQKSACMRASRVFLHPIGQAVTRADSPSLGGETDCLFSLHEDMSFLTSSFVLCASRSLDLPQSGAQCRG
ncbi:hypothetical protein AK812_SmicGene42709 [Symbiodinium microadriaticum]|uniref:Uncharacterized protein n=1 Tax=Symbiodinium microadriaticum TaxID=2951 RepID=A0A1Q9C2U9_SYMMI|nr:hypothetical protein AK812_SmicGene42709 [Symbiodinium microadriaticum]